MEMGGWHSGRMKRERYGRSILKICINYDIDTQEEDAVHMCGFDGIWRGNYFGGEPIGKAEVEVRVGKLKNGKDAGWDEITGEMIQGGGDRVVDWIWRLQYGF